MLANLGRIVRVADEVRCPAIELEMSALWMLRRRGEAQAWASWVISRGLGPSLEFRDMCLAKQTWCISSVIQAGDDPKAGGGIR